MSARRRATMGARLGAAIGAGYFVADLTGALLAVGWLFVPSPGGLALVGIGGLVAVALGAGLGALAGPLWPARLVLPPRRALALGVLSALGVAAGSFALRHGRNLEAPGARPPVSAARPAPILFVLVDTLRADTLYGEALDFPLAPATRALAARSTVLADAESAAGWTIPSMASLLTGLHSSTLDASAGSVPGWAPTLPQMLRAAGYATHAVVDNTLVEPRHGFGRGFESFYQRSAYRFAFSLPTFRLLPGVWREALRYSFRTSDLGSPGVTDEALRLIASAGEAPLFLYVHYMDPHAPYYEHEDLPPPPPGAEPVFLEPVGWRLRRGEGPPPTAGELAWLRHRYDNEVRALDRDLGRLFAAWEARFGERGVVILTSDHGEEFLDHGQLQHSLTVHREMVHVPLLLKLEGVAPSVVRTPVHHLDVLPTLLEAVGVSPLPGPPLAGHSWLPWLRGAASAPERPLLACHSRHGRSTYRYREGSWAYIKTMFYDERPTQNALFDLAADPHEQRNLFAEAPHASAMASRFEALAKEVTSPTHRRGKTAQSDEEALRALGYVQ